MSEHYSWYPVYTHARAEKKAYEALVRKGLECYLPLSRTLKQWSDRKKWVEEPLIRSYLFVRIGAKQQAEVLMTPGVCRFLYFSGKIATMPERQIEQLKLLLASSAELEVTDHTFEPGDQVLVKAGALQGLRGELVSHRSAQRFLVRLDHIGQSLLVQVPAAYLEPLVIQKEGGNKRV